MATDQFDDLLKRMPKIAEIVNKFQSEAVQVEVYRTLVSALSMTGNGSEEADADRSKNPNKKPSTKIKKPESQKNDDSDSDVVDTNDIVNTMKNRKDFQTLSRMIFHKHNRWNKIRAILFYADLPMTSGEIHQVFTAFDLKIGLSSISGKLKEMHSELITSGTRKSGARVRYKLSGPAKSDTEKWLHEILK